MRFFVSIPSVLRAAKSTLNGEICQFRGVAVWNPHGSFSQIRNFSCNMSGKKALALLAEGSEEMELTISVDVLRRAGIEVTVASLHGIDPVKCSRDVKIQPDASLEEAASKGPYDVIVLPGGLGGSNAFASSEKVGAILKEQESSGRLIAAICAAPTALKAHGVCLNKKITCHPSQTEKLTDGGKYTVVNDRVVVDGKLVTSQGPGTTFEFGLAIIEQLIDKETASNVAKPLVLA